MNNNAKAASHFPAAHRRSVVEIVTIPFLPLLARTLFNETSTELKLVREAFS